MDPSPIHAQPAKPQSLDFAGSVTNLSTKLVRRAYEGKADIRKTEDPNTGQVPGIARAANCKGRTRRTKSFF